MLHVGMNVADKSSLFGEVARVLCPGARFAIFGVRPQDIRFERETWFFRHEGPPTELLKIFRDYYGPTMNAFEAAAGAGREADLERELKTLFIRQNRGGERTEIPATFLKVTVNKS